MSQMGLRGEMQGLGTATGVLKSPPFQLRAPNDASSEARGTQTRALCSRTSGPARLLRKGACVCLVTLAACRHLPPSRNLRGSAQNDLHKHSLAGHAEGRSTGVRRRRGAPQYLLVPRV